MKKVISYLRSMRFGILLLILVAICSVIGSVIPQGRDIAWYAQSYGSAHPALLALGFDNIFESWYFIVILALLCVNLTLCSVVRISKVVSAAEGESSRTFALPDTVRLSPEGVEKLREELLRMRCRVEKRGGSEVYTKRSFGRYGSFITHLSILLTVIFGALALYVPRVTDHSCLPGESVVLRDGTEIYVSDFHIADETGRFDFTSHIIVTLPNGRQSGLEEIKVNYPFSFGGYKIYQQTYASAPSLSVTNPAMGATSDFIPEQKDFFSLDYSTGLMYIALYPDYIVDPSGNITLISSVEGRYENPIYEAILVTDGGMSSVLLLPGEEVEAGGLVFRFNEPVEYPGLRVKYTPPIVNVLLIAAFAMMLAGLYMTFFCDPVLVKLDSEGYCVGGPKPERMRVELGELLGEYELCEGEDNK